MPVAITGANGHLGLRLLEELGSDAVAVVRSDRARSTVLAQHPGVPVRVVDYTDAGSLADALEGCNAVVHLVGIIKETSQSSFEAAHEQSCTALTEAAHRAGVQHIVYLSLIGAAASSGNRCLASRGRAEAILSDGKVPAAIIRIPMVLGEGDYASMALKRNACAGTARAFRAESLEQPIYAGDVIAAVRAALDKHLDATLDLAGPESLPRRQLIQRAARILGCEVRVQSLPLWLGMTVAGLLELLPNPPVSRAMLGVLDHDDQVDVAPACAALGLNLTPLDEMLTHVLKD